jgi:coenzyme F420-reducing hydrogenase delta subunit
VALLGTILDQMGMPQERVRFVELSSLDRYVLPRLIDSLSQDVKSLVAAPV